MNKQLILDAEIARRGGGRKCRVVVGRKTIFGRCKDCGERWRYVKVYLKYRKSEKEYRVLDSHVCFNCGRSEVHQNMTTFDC